MSVAERPARAPWKLGLIAAAMTVAVDQAAKLWLLHGFGLAARGRVHLVPFLDLVLAWNTGISYGLFQQSGAAGRWTLLAFKAIAVALLLLWLTRTRSLISGLALGLIVGGAIGNAIDSILHGAVMDFVLFHFTAGAWNFQWYVFNLADAAIVIGVAALVGESLFARDAAKAP